jgi:DNA gyrase/topoisomerase IV subunit A
VASELDAAAEAYGTPRRTLLMNAAPPKPRATKGAVDLQIADAPTALVLSTTGRAVRIDLAEGQELAAPARRSKHDAILTTFETTVRAEIGALTSAGRVVRFSPVDLPSVPSSSVQLAAGTPLRDYPNITTRGERIVGFVRFDSETPIALGTVQGTVKRIVPSTIPVRPEIEVIALKSGDAVVGSAEGGGDGHLTVDPGRDGHRPVADGQRRRHDLDEADVEVREVEDRVLVVDEDRPLPVHQAHVRAAQRDVGRRRHLEQVREQRLLAVDMEHDVLDHGPILGRRSSPCQPDFGPVRGGRSR